MNTGTSRPVRLSRTQGKHCADRYVSVSKVYEQTPAWCLSTLRMTSNSSKIREHDIDTGDFVSFVITLASATPVLSLTDLETRSGSQQEEERK